MYNTEGRVAILDRINNDPDGKKVIYLIESLILILHLFVDGEKVLDSAVYFGGNTRFFYMFANLFNDAGDIFFSFGPAHLDLC